MDWPGRSAFSEASLSALTINGKTVGQYKSVADTNLTFVYVGIIIFSPPVLTHYI